MRRLAIVISTLLVTAATWARAEAAPPKATSAPEASAAVGGAPARFDVAHGLCKDFLALPPDLRGLVVAWTAGRYHKLDRWVMDEPTARKVITGVQQACESAPDALFRYKVVGEIDKLN
jgi:hypothetical protein